MSQNLTLIGLFGLLWAVALWLANKCGSKKAQLEAIKEEIKRQAKEQERANEINNRVSNMSDDDVIKRLSDLKSKQR